MTIFSICIRLLTAMLIGALIGGERESIHRPAGLRTHMLVSTSAAVVMMLGMYLSSHFAGITNADPARLGAQVISGIGFLGAGTILREGLTIKGLTTAASLWTVACLGLSAGAGFYPVALIGTLVIFITLTVFERLQGRMIRTRYVQFVLSITCTEIAACMTAVGQYANANHLLLFDFEIQKNAPQYYVTMRIKCEIPHQTVDQQALLTTLSQADCILQIKLNPA